MSSASSQEKLVTRWWKISITGARRRTAGGRPNVAGWVRWWKIGHRRPRSWSCEHRESPLRGRSTMDCGAASAILLVDSFAVPEKRRKSPRPPAKSAVFGSVKRTSSYVSFTGGISVRDGKGTSHPTVDVVRNGQRLRVHQAGWLAPSGGASRVDHAAEPVRRRPGCRIGNVTATLNSCAVCLVDPEFSEPRR